MLCDRTESYVQMTVGAMFYISPQLTVLMLAVVPPVSLGAVSNMQQNHSCIAQISALGFLWSIPETAIQQNPGGPRRNDEGNNNILSSLVLLHSLVTCNRLRKSLFPLFVRCRRTTP